MKQKQQHQLPKQSTPIVKVRKNPIKYNITLNEEQTNAKRIILENVMTLLMGSAGSGKSLCACNIALDMFFKKEVEKIIICRPAVSKEEIGFLPGSADEKLMPYLQPLLNNFYNLSGREKIDNLLKEGIIQIIPFAFLRGWTFTNSVIIVDEAQNMKEGLTELVLGRMGIGSKMIICGDAAQCDLTKEVRRGFADLTKIAQKVDGFAVVELQKNHRHPIVEQILNVYKELQAENKYK